MNIVCNTICSWVSLQNSTLELLLKKAKEAEAIISLFQLANEV